MSDEWDGAMLLTPAILKEIYPVVQTDRRRFSDQFAFIGKPPPLDDDVFYAALLERLRSDATYCFWLNRAFIATGRIKDKDRSLVMRLGRWLDKQLPGFVSSRGKDEAIYEQMSPLHHEVAQIWAHAIDGGPPNTAEAVTDLQPQSNWQILRDGLLGLLDTMTVPDPDMAEDILALAKDLQSSCETALLDARNALQFSTRRDALVVTLAEAGAFEAGTALRDRLETLEDPALLDQVEASLQPLPAELDIWRNAISELEAARQTEDKARLGDRQALRAAMNLVDESEAHEAEAKDGVLRVLTAVEEIFETHADFQAILKRTNEPAATQDAQAASPDPEQEPEVHELTSADVAEDKPELEADVTFPASVTAPETETAAEHDSLGSRESTSEQLATLFALLQEPEVVSPATEDLLLQSENNATNNPAVWTGRLPLADLLALYLNRGQVALAWHLAELAEERGFMVPVPPPLLRALAAGSAITGPYEHSTQMMGEILAAAISRLEGLQHASQAESLRARTLALAAMMRPALIARDTNARELLGNLSMAGPLTLYSGVIQALTGLRHDLQPSLADLTGLAGVDNQRREPGVLAEIEQWLPGARGAQSMHAPSNTVLHQMLAPDSRLGTLLEAAQNRQISRVEANLDYLHRLIDDTTFGHDLIAEQERINGRPRSDRIRGMARDWITRKLREGAELVLRWQAATRDDAAVGDHRREDLRPYINALRKALDNVADSNSEMSAPETDLDSAVERCLTRAIAEMTAILNGQPVETAIRVQDALNRPLLRLPGPAQPRAPEDPSFANERRDQRNALFSALQRPDELAPDDISALEHHLNTFAILPAQDLLELLERAGRLSDLEVQAQRQVIAERRVAATDHASRTMTALRQELEPLQSIDLSTSQRIQLWLDRLKSITNVLESAPDAHVTLPMTHKQRLPDIPPDFPQLEHLLDRCRAVRDSVREQIMVDQARRLATLAEQFTRDGRIELALQARELASSLGERDLLTVEDILLRLQDGQNPSLSKDEGEDDFRSFYPDFVIALSDADADTGPNAVLGAISRGETIGPLDFAALEENERKRSLQLFETWRQLVNATSRKVGDTSQPLRQFMEQIGFTSVHIERETILSERLRWMRMRSDELTAQDWFLPPAFGSEARGSYPVFLAHRNTDDAQLVAELSKVGRDASCILLVFGRMSRSRRENFALAMRKAKQTVLLIDETQVVYLTLHRSWMKRLFGCAMPFGYLQPYTTSSGNIPGEMFFGRVKEIADIESATTDGCLVYGGRQLGKSALLHHVRKRFHNPQIGRHAYYLKIDEFGGQVHPAAHIWSEIRRALPNEIVLPNSSDNAPDVSKGIVNWLDRNGERRILVLIDEADMFLASETRSGFPNLNLLKDLMEITARRFKVVFAGLHNVQRLARAPNSPLIHLANPICIGPLNTTSESSAHARQLVREPMRAAGFDYASPDLMQALLTRVNYYPSLVQVFCKALLEGIANQPRPPGTGPRWVLKKEHLFDSSAAGDINARIRERFQWTLNLDPRYELIAKVLALHRLNSADRDGALIPSALACEVEDFWPRGFAKLPSEDFTAFLDEMKDLGVLIRLNDGSGRYGLRGAQVAQMLGHRDQLETEILAIAEKEPRIDYDPSFYHRRVRPDINAARSPLSDNALNTLFDTSRPGLRYVIAPPGLWGTDAARTIADMAEGWRNRDGQISGTVLRDGENELSQIVKSRTGRRVIVINTTGKVPGRWAAWLADQPKVKSGEVLPVFVGSHEQIAQLLPQSGTELLRFPARPWERAMLRTWLVEMGLQLLDQPDCLAALLRVSGGSPLLLGRLRPRLEELVSNRTRDNAAEVITEFGKGFELMPMDVGLPDNLVPVYCAAAELLPEWTTASSPGSQTTLQDLIEFLAADGNTHAAQELDLFQKLGLMLNSNSSHAATLALTPLGALVLRSCNRPRSNR